MLPVKSPVVASSKYRSQVFPELGKDASATMGNACGDAKLTLTSLQRSSSGHGKCVLQERLLSKRQKTMI